MRIVGSSLAARDLRERGLRKGQESTVFLAGGALQVSKDGGGSGYGNMGNMPTVPTIEKRNNGRR